jgi:hypothetical protein
MKIKRQILTIDRRPAANKQITNNITNIESMKIFIARNLILIILTFQISSCTGQVKEKSANDKIENGQYSQPLFLIKIRHFRKFTPI